MLQVSKSTEAQKHWTYAFIREDLPVSQQAIQAGHALLELGIKHGPSPDGHPSIIFLSTKNKEQLEAALEYARSQELKTFEFYEPYQDWGLTSFAIQPIPQEQRHLFSNYKLWRK